MTPTGHRYSDPIQESQIYRAAYPEKFTTEPIVPAETVEDKTQSGEIQLTRDQKVALDAIVDYVKKPLDPSNCAICINGFAGTGKTTLINYVLQELVDQGEQRTQGVVVSAVSHQATINIFNKIEFDEEMRKELRSVVYNAIIENEYDSINKETVGEYFKVYYK